MKIIVEKDLFLRPIKMSDAADFFAFAKEQKVTKYLTYLPHKNIEETKEVITKFFLPSPDISKLVIEKNGVMIGTCNINQRQKEDKKAIYVLGYQLNPQYWGQQIMTKCAMALIAYFFKVYPHETLYIHAFIDNIGSWKVIEKLGFKPSEEYMSIAECQKTYPLFKDADFPKAERQRYAHNATTWKAFITK